MEKRDPVNLNQIFALWNPSQSESSLTLILTPLILGSPIVLLIYLYKNKPCTHSELAGLSLTRDRGAICLCRSKLQDMHVYLLVRWLGWGELVRLGELLLEGGSDARGEPQDPRRAGLLHSSHQNIQAFAVLSRSIVIYIHYYICSALTVIRGPPLFSKTIQLSYPFPAGDC